MPAMANITVQNAAAANVIYVAKVPSAGDRSPAKWTQDALTVIAGFRPRIDVVTRDNGNKDGRIVEGNFSYPVTATVNGVETLLATVPMRFNGTLPTNVDSTKVNDACVQFGNLLASTLFRSVFSEGYAPT